jgi:hypothetical protein
MLGTGLNSTAVKSTPVAVTGLQLLGRSSFISVLYLNLQLLSPFD